MEDIIERPVVMFAGPCVVVNYMFTAGCVAAAAPQCEGMPLTLNHAMKGPIGEMAASLGMPVEIDRDRIPDITFGRVTNPVYKSPHLCGIAVIDMAKLSELSPELHGRIKGGEVIEVCLAWSDLRGMEQQGGYKDARYTRIVTRAKPSSLAALHHNLRNFRGHCPVSEGFGLGVEYRKEQCHAK